MIDDSAIPNLFTTDKARFTESLYCNAIIFAICFMMCITGCGRAKKIASQTHKVKWGYAAENGPAVWGQLNQEYFLCGVGTHQSPIDIVNPIPTKLPTISYEYHPATGVNIHHNGHTIEVRILKAAESISMAPTINCFNSFPCA